MTYTLQNCVVYTGSGVIPDARVVIEGSRIKAVGERSNTKLEGESVDLDGRTVTSGFVDLQVNGGGDVLFNESPTSDALNTLVTAHSRFGTTNMLPTYITGPVSGMIEARSAVEEYRRSGASAVLGIHFEGPSIATGKLGVHDGAFASSSFPLHTLEGASMPTFVTLAPEAVEPETIAKLKATGAFIAVGHSNATYEQALAAIREGAQCATHLYNAMSQLTSREPGVVGAFLASDEAFVNVIADGHHCHFGSIAVAWKAKPAGKLFLVTDAMPPVGGNADGYVLGPWTVTVADGKCVTGDGVLAGSALDMATAVRNCVQKVGIPKDEAFRMASLYPAQFLRADTWLGRVEPGYLANLVICDNEVHVDGVVMDGQLQRFE